MTLLSFSYAYVNTETLTKVLGLSSIKVMSLLLLLNKLGMQRVKFEHVSIASTVLDIIRNIKNDIGECGSWLDVYEDSKPTVVLVCGFTLEFAITKHLDSWKKQFNIYVLQPVFNSWTDYLEISYGEMLRRYELQLEKDIPQEIAVQAFFGFSFGGELSYHLAYWWNVTRGNLPAVMMGDSRIKRADQAFAERIKKDNLTELEKFYVDFLMKFLIGSPDFPQYVGKTVLFSAVEADGASDNEEKWKVHNSDIEIIQLADSHKGLFEHESNYSIYLNLLDKLGD